MHRFASIVANSNIFSDPRTKYHELKLNNLTINALEFVNNCICDRCQKDHPRNLNYKKEIDNVTIHNKQNQNTIEM